MIEVDVLAFRDIFESSREHRHRNAAEIEALAARYDRCGELLQLCRGKYEYNVRRRLLKRFEQRIEGALRQHMHLVDDINAVSEA